MRKTHRKARKRIDQDVVIMGIPPEDEDEEIENAPKAEMRTKRGGYARNGFSTAGAVATARQPN